MRIYFQVSHGRFYEELVKFKVPETEPYLSVLQIGLTDISVVPQPEVPSLKSFSMQGFDEFESSSVKEEVLETVEVSNMVDGVDRLISGSSCKESVACLWVFFVLLWLK